MKEDFTDYMSYYKELNLKDKQKIIINQLKVLVSLTQKMCEGESIPNEVLLSKEILDVQSEEYKEDDFAEAAIVLINSIQNSICDYYLSKD